MTAGIPNEMRRTAWVSLAAHLAVLALLFMVPFVTMPPMGASPIQVLLVSNATAPARPLPVEPRPEARPVEKVRAPMPPPVPERLKEVAAPKPVQNAPVAAPAAPSKPRPAESLATAPSPPVVKPAPAAPSSVAAPPAPRMSDAINKLLSQLPSAPPVSPAPTVARAPQGAVAPRSAALERCPSQAQAYCPLLEAAINRVWSADTDSGVRRVLESAGDSTATMRMVILPDGVISAIQISTSSGNDAYDRAVQSLLRELRHLPPLPADMQGEPLVVLTNFTYSRTRE